MYWGISYYFQNFSYLILFGFFDPMLVSEIQPQALKYILLASSDFELTDTILKILDKELKSINLN